jgi:hypothetical protein
MSDALLDALWHKVEQNWTDDAAHDRFLNQCAQQGSLALAASRYRTAMQEQGRDSARHLERITHLAMSQIDASRTPPKTVRRNAQNLVAIALLLSLTLALLVLASR